MCCKIKEIPNARLLPVLCEIDLGSAVSQAVLH